MSAHCAPTAPTFSYFVCMIDFGRKGYRAAMAPPCNIHVASSVGILDLSQ